MYVLNFTLFNYIVARHKILLAATTSRERQTTAYDYGEVLVWMCFLCCVNIPALISHALFCMGYEGKAVFMPFALTWTLFDGS